MNPANLAPDLGTVIFLMLLSTTLVLGLNWRMHPRIAGTGPWFGAYLAFVSAAVALSLRRHVPELSSILVGNTLLTAGHLAMLWGACVFAGLEPPRRLVAALLLVAALGSLYFHVVTPSYAARWWLLGLIAAGASLYSLARPLRRLAQHDGLLGVGMYAGATVMSAGLMLAVAAWMIYVRGTDLNGQPIEVKDPLAAILRDAATSLDPVGALLSLRQVFPPDLAARLDPHLRAVHAALMAKGAKPAMETVR